MTKFNQTIRDWIKLLLGWLPDPAFYRYKYYVAHRSFCNFAEPRRFSEKIFHRMRYPVPIFSRLADKVAARGYIARIVGEQYLVPAFLACEHVTPATFDRLPKAFVMKSNHSAGQIKIVLDKSKEDPVKLSRLANAWLKSDFTSRTREKHYRGIPPKILFEQPLLDEGRPPADFKFNVFNPGPGEKPFVFVQHIKDRFEDMTQDLYLEDWTPAPFMFTKIQKPSGTVLPRFEALEEMLQLAKKLSEPFGYLRVDFYLHEGRVYVGELTVTPGAGRYDFDPPEWDWILGDKFGWPEAVLPADFQENSPMAGKGASTDHTAFPWSSQAHAAGKGSHARCEGGTPG